MEINFINALYTTQLSKSNPSADMLKRRKKLTKGTY